MKIGTRYAAVLAAPILLWGATAFGQTAPSPASPAGTPQTVEGQVVKIDRSQGRVTIRTASGTIHEFHGLGGDPPGPEGGRPHRGAAPALAGPREPPPVASRRAGDWRECSGAAECHRSSDAPAPSAGYGRER